MKEIPLNMVEKQSLSVLLDGSMYELSFKTCNGIIAATIVKDGVTIVENRRVVAGIAIIPEGHLEDSNFIILTYNDDLPYFEQFDGTHVLVYANSEEVVALRQQLNNIVVRKEEKQTSVTPPVIVQPEITKQPVSQTIDETKTLSLSVTATGAVSYQWRKDGIILPGGNKSTYTILSTTTKDAGNYTVIITGEKYSSAVQSAPAVIKVTPIPVPVFTTQPTASIMPPAGAYKDKNLVFVPTGNNLNINGAVATNAFSYQWQELQADDTWKDIAGQTSQNLNLASYKDEGSYRLSATNTSGTTYSNIMTAFNSFLFIQNDSVTTPTSNFGVQKIDDSHYKMTNPTVSSTTRYIGGFVRKPSAPTTNIAGIDVTNATATTTDATVAKPTQTSGRQTVLVLIRAGKATVSISFGGLTSYLDLDVK